MITLPMSTNTYEAALQHKILGRVAAWFGCVLKRDERNHTFTLNRSPNRISLPANGLEAVSATTEAAGKRGRK